MARKNTQSKVVQLKPAIPRQKLKLTIEDLVYLNPLTHNQAKFFNLYNKSSEFIILSGFPGTGKSFISLYKALEEALTTGNKINKVVMIRSAVETRSLGALPGTLDEKISVYEQPYIDICAKLFEKNDAYTRLKEQKYLEFHSTSFLRSITFDNSILIAEECQNMTIQELDTIITRLGNNSKLIMCGDYNQTDLNKNSKDKSGLLEFLDIAKKMSSFRMVNFEQDDIVRGKLVKEYIIAKYS